MACRVAHGDGTIRPQLYVERKSTHILVPRLGQADESCVEELRPTRDCPLEPLMLLISHGKHQRHRGKPSESEKIRFAGHDVFDVRYPDRRRPCSAAKGNVVTQQTVPLLKSEEAPPYHKATICCSAIPGYTIDPVTGLTSTNRLRRRRVDKALVGKKESSFLDRDTLAD